jgi:hypothetical protein
MVTYRELEAFASVGLFHNDPTVAHSASSQIDVDCALATAVNNVRTTTAGTIVRWKTETKVFIASTLLTELIYLALRIARVRLFNMYRSLSGSRITATSRFSSGRELYRNASTFQLI